MIDDRTLLDYIRDGLSAERSREVEAALREQSELRTRLSQLMDENCGNEVAPGTIWRESQLSCPSREEWGSFLLGILDSEKSDYFQFHLETVECPFCRANVDDLQEQHQASASQRIQRQERVFRSSVGAMRLSRSSDSISRD